MNASKEFGRDGNVGLGVLALMTIAFIGGEAQSDWPTQVAESSDRRAPLETHLLIDMDRSPAAEEIGGAIRELSVVPFDVDHRLELGWAPEDIAIEEYRRSGF